jgi:hypothetical protein
MENYKATLVDFIRRRFQKSPEAEPVFNARLSTDDQAAFRVTLPMSWISAELGGRFMDAGAHALFPDAPDPVWEFSRQQAHDNITGIYKIILRVVTVPIVISKAARVWGTYHRKGKATVSRVDGENRASFIAEEYPKLPDVLRRSVTGYTTGLLELTGAEDIEVALDDSNPDALRWDVTWR